VFFGCGIFIGKLAQTNGCYFAASRIFRTVAWAVVRLSHVFIQNRSLPLAAVLGLYGLVILVTYVLWHKTRLLKPDNSTDKGELYDEPLSAIH